MITSLRRNVLCALLFVAFVAATSISSAQEAGQYLFIGTGNGDDGDAINLQETEFGANQMFLSSNAPNLADVFAGRWSSDTNSTIPNIPAAAPVCEGITYTGQMAITSTNGRFTMSDSNVYATNFAVRCASSTGICQQNSTSNSIWFTPTTPPMGGPPVNSGSIDSGAGVVGGFNHSGLNNELIQAHSSISNFSAEHTITSSFVNGASSLNIDAFDTNNDGIAVIDIDVGDNDFELNNYDLILEGNGNTFAVFRIRGDTNMLMSNSSIALGTGGIGGGSSTSPIKSLGAAFVQYEEPDGNTDQVFNFNNFILNGVAIWDLNAYRNGAYDDSWSTEANLQNGQGCSQFISSFVTHTSSGRWNHCGLSGRAPRLFGIPEPSTSMVLLLSGSLLLRRSRKSAA